MSRTKSMTADENVAFMLAGANTSPDHRLLGGNSSSSSSWQTSFTEKGTKFFGVMKATATSAAQAARGVATVATVAAASSKRSSSQKPHCKDRTSAMMIGGPMSLHVDDRRSRPGQPQGRDQQIQAICAMGFSVEAAAMALHQCSGDVNAACLWLLDDGNTEDVLAAEAAERLAAEQQRQKRRMSSDGRGLGMGRGRPSSSEESSSSVSSSDKSSFNQDPVPEQTSGVLDRPAFPAGPAPPVDPALPEWPAPPAGPVLPDGPAPTVAEVTYAHGSRSSQASSIISVSDLSDSGDEARLDDEELRALEAQVRNESRHVPIPPMTSCWEWPLSREEKKARVLLADKRVQLLDRQMLMEALVNERIALRGALGDQTGSSATLYTPRRAERHGDVSA